MQCVSGLLKRNIILITRWGGRILKVTSTLHWGRARRLESWTALGRRACGLRGLTVLPAAPAWHELDIVRNDLVFAAFLAFCCLPTAPLQATLNQSETALAEIFARRLGLASERDDVDEADLLFLLILLAVAPINRQTERRHRRALRRRTQLGIPR